MADSTVYSKIATLIVRAQFNVIGPLAFDQAKQVEGVVIGTENSVVVQANGKETVEKLVKQFERLFGQASLEVCKDAVRELHIVIPRDFLPEILK